MMSLPRYGNSWEKYPIKENEIWVDLGANSVVAAGDLTKIVPTHLGVADMVYCDPPWSLGNLNCFYTKAGRNDYFDRFEVFCDCLFWLIAEIDPRVCFLEIGRQHVMMFRNRLQRIFAHVQTWGVTYYRKKPCFLLRGGRRPTQADYAGLDEKNIPEITIANEIAASVADMCTGQGLTGIAAFKKKIPFYGLELNPRRLAVMIDKVNKLGGNYVPYGTISG